MLISMRCRFTRKLLILFAVCFVIYEFYLNYMYFYLYSASASPNTTAKVPKLVLHDLVTIVLRQFELYENDVTQTALNFKYIFPEVAFWIVYDEIPYPALDLNLSNKSLSNIKLHNLSPTLNHQPTILNHIQTEYALMIPDSIRMTSQKPLKVMLEAVRSNPGSIIVAPIGSKSLKCLRLNVNEREWSLKYSTVKGSTCDAVSGRHLILARKKILDMLHDPFLLPFPKAMYVQSSAQNVRIKIIKVNSIHNGKPIFKSHHSQLKRRQLDQERLKHFYKKFKIKQVIRETGTTEWYGCTKDTARCFGLVLDNMPSYLLEKKWTPPCCMSNLRKTARHVFEILDESGVRYWLEAGSLLGAMRSGDILPWDHNVDIGFIREDLSRCKWLNKSQTKPIIDKEGFYWEKSTDGNIFKVTYSKTNKITVNLFPFYSKNGSMVKDSWFTSHKNMEFPESYLHPMSSIEFVGRTVPSPNNIRDFLEGKYGRGCIENPRYPDGSFVSFS